MEMDRRRLLRRISQAAAVTACGALAATGPGRRPAPPPVRPAPLPPTAAGVSARTVAAAAPAVGWYAPPPPIVPRAQWQTDGRPPPPPAQYTRGVRAVFIHHTDGGNGYRHTDVPAIIRGIYGDHHDGRDWDDIGYNFLVDRNGTIYEGRHGGVDRPVVGAHTLGFNHETVGIAAIGTYRTGEPVPWPVVDAIAAIAAWKLGRYGVDPRGTAELTSTNDASRFRAGTRHVFPAVSGHRDAFCTLCPGEALYAALPAIRERAARLQGRPRPPEPGPAAPADVAFKRRGRR
ncbi:MULTISPECIES: peptidoglycan recognition protein family protein [Streptomycetaceae]|uniref:N-acetylmuramoyl-L-alanine amidase n=1 Tax=Streptantibioticus cattleyicolor (strain ATCC 35852 / DSM 46488 / JCM 4925 / NBRC 14057 / NRRL 8057) TaxID=1003195 RepID=F8K3K7_STREN|nr:MULTISPECIES: peptidoglycan recognition protein [Streptomycetaceae]AEW96325.1 hypothetical protein SCATT_39540 [Streptantibioticus cattleyicolor NRRL 8057 = DSM 46488]MYS60840.1 N-acetylmuramoyl-L-alanine amidase [Streptomyces sp. SID5468]CCB76665.1 conserved exported protein of unknown function [Streptantibioticus cattleyicolor NRRL 8057 = DSM 46488]